MSDAMIWERLQREARDLAFAGSHEAAAERLHRAVSSLDFSQRTDRIIAGRLRSDLAWLFSSTNQHARTLFTAQRAMTALESEDAECEAYCWAANSAAIAAWHLYGPAACAQFAENGVQHLRPGGTHTPRIEALLRGNLGLAWHTTGRHDEAIVELQASLEIFQRLKAHDDVRAGQRRLANAYQDAGHLLLSERLMELSRPPENSTTVERAAWLNGWARLLERLGRPLDAASTYDEAVLLFSELGDRATTVAAILSNAALLDIDLARPATARERATQIESIVENASAPLHSRVGLHRIRAALALAEDDKEKALQVWQSAAGLFERDAGGDRAQLGEIHAYIANLQLALERKADAQATLERYLAPRVDDLPVYAVQPAALLASLLLEDGATERALDLLRRALDAELARREPEQLWRVYSGFADAVAEAGLPTASILLGKLAVEQVNATSRQLETDRTALRSYLHQRLVPHRRLIDRLAAAGRLPEAMHIQRRIKVEQMAEIVRRDRSLSSPFEALPKSVNEEAAADAIEQVSRALIWARDATVDWRLLPRQRAEAGQRLTALRQTSSGVIDSLLALPPEPKPPPLIKTLAGSDTGLVIRFMTGEEKMAALASLNGELVQEIAIAAPVHEIGRRVHDLLTAIDELRPVDEPARWLYDRLLRPLSPLLDQVSHVAFTCDGPLAYVPFACLMGERGFLVEGHSIAIRTGVTVPRMPRRERALWRSAAFISETGFADLAPLVFAGREREALARHAPHLTTFSDQDFSGRALIEGFINFEHIHVASHFALAPAAAQRSVLHLGDGRTVDLATLRRAVPDMSGIELLVLSCCDTGTRDQGELGPDSFAAVAHAAGAKDVIATLWPVADASTAALIEQFYDNLFAASRDVAVAVALQQAQLRLLRGLCADNLDAAGMLRGMGAPTQRPADWTHPYHWAGVTCFVGGG